jgi:two-component system response regulator DevR
MTACKSLWDGDHFKASLPAFILSWDLGDILADSQVYIIDERKPLRSALAERLTQAEDLQVIGHSGKSSGAVEEIRKLNPDLVLLELKRSDGKGVELLKMITGLPMAPKVAVLTSYPVDWEEAAAKKAGAVAYLMKNINSGELIERIRSLAQS